MNYQKWLMALIMLGAVALFLIAGSAFAEIRLITWEAATQYTNGDPLPYGKVWTVVNQYDLGCPPVGSVVAGEAKINLPVVVQSAEFEVPSGTCSCFEAVTWVFGDPIERYISAPVYQDVCTEASGSCHDT